MNWDVKTIGELCHIEKGKIGITKAIPGEFPLVVTSEERKSHNEYHFDTEAVVIPLVSSTGHGHKSLKRIHYQAGKFAVGNILCAVIPKDKSIINAEYLYHYLNLNREKELVSRMKGMANVSLPMKEIAKIEVPIPPLDEQKNFVEEYKLLEDSNSDLNNEIEKQLDLIKQLRQAFLREAIQGKLTTKWRVENPDIEPASELLKKIKAEKEKLIKEGKLQKQKPLPPIKEDEIPFDYNENARFVRLGYVCSVEKGKIGIKKAISGDISLVVTGEERFTHNEVHFSGNGVIVPIVSSTGHGHASLKRIHYQEGDFAVGNILACIMPILTEYFNMKFLYHYLDYYKKEFFIDKMKGAANVSLKISSIKETPIPVIDIIVQNQFEKLIKVCDKLEESIKTSQQQNERLLQQVLREALEPKN